MITKAFSIYDSKALHFGVPFFMSSVGGAVRAFSDLCNDPQTMISRHPGDYVLYELGSFDDAVGKMVSLSPHMFLGMGSEFCDNKRMNIGEYKVKEVLQNPLATVEELNGKN